MYIYIYKFTFAQWHVTGTSPLLYLQLYLLVYNSTCMYLLYCIQDRTVQALGSLVSKHDDDDDDDDDGDDYVLALKQINKYIQSRM